ncbi:hypothetical protein DV735_g2006, partial [Chaetothyriales sp. CBS 134920]
MAQTSLYRYFAPKSALTGKEHLEDDSRASDASAETAAAVNTSVEEALVTRKPSRDVCKDETAGQGRHSHSSTPPPGISIVQIEQAHLNAIRLLTSTTLPMRYSDKFYKQAILDPGISSLTRVALFDDEPVGWIRCCLESGRGSSTSGDQASSQIYIQALCLLGPYRGHGVATQLLDSILRALPVQGQQASSIYAHVWEQNDDALGCMEQPTDELDSDVESTQSESSEADSEFRPEFEVSREEARDLQRGLSAWEIHDLERLGYPLYRLIEQFPEIEMIYDRGQVEEELVHALDELPMFLPFIMNLMGATPLPYMLHYLQKHGFCHRNEHSEALRAAIQTGHDIPSYEEILSNTIPIFIMQTPQQYLEGRLAELVSATAFPNGCPRVSDTDSSLPRELEDYIVQHVDGNAFGHQTRQKWEVEGPDPSRLDSMSLEEVQRWAYVDILLQEAAMHSWLGTRQEANTRFALWAVESEADFGIGDVDGDSVCSVTLFPDEPTWNEWARVQAQSGCACDSEHCFRQQHEARHVARKLQRLAHRGGYPVRLEMIEWTTERWLTARDMIRRAGADEEGVFAFNLRFWQRSRDQDMARYAGMELERDQEVGGEGTEMEIDGDEDEREGTEMETDGGEEHEGETDGNRQ